MTLNTKISTSARNAAVDAITALLGAGSQILIRTGAPPTNPSDADSGALLATLNASADAFGDGATGVATANTITSATAAASGTAGYFRWKTSGGTVIFQGTAGVSGDTPNLVFDNATIVSGGTVSITAFTLTVPQAGS